MCEKFAPAGGCAESSTLPRGDRPSIRARVTIGSSRLATRSNDLVSYAAWANFDQARLIDLLLRHRADDLARTWVLHESNNPEVPRICASLEFDLEILIKSVCLL
jgi:hypothetical protein